MKDSNDLISRQAVIEAIKGLPTWWADDGGYYGGAQPPMEALLEPEDVISAIENVPSWSGQERVCKERYADLLAYFDGDDRMLKDHEEFVKWLDRMKWHVRECDKLGRELDTIRKQMPELEEMTDRYGYIGIETLLNFCMNSKDRACTPNDLMMMKRITLRRKSDGE